MAKRRRKRHDSVQATAVEAALAAACAAGPGPTVKALDRLDGSLDIGSEADRNKILVVTAAGAPPQVYCGGVLLPSFFLSHPSAVFAVLAGNVANGRYDDATWRLYVEKIFNFPAELAAPTAAVLYQWWMDSSRAGAKRVHKKKYRWPTVAALTRDILKAIRREQAGRLSGIRLRVPCYDDKGNVVFKPTPIESLSRPFRAAVTESDEGCTLMRGPGGYYWAVDGAAPPGQEGLLVDEAATAVSAAWNTAIRTDYTTLLLGVGFKFDEARFLCTKHVGGLTTLEAGAELGLTPAAAGSLERRVNRRLAGISKAKLEAAALGVFGRPKGPRIGKRHHEKIPLDPLGFLPFKAIERRHRRWEAERLRFWREIREAPEKKVLKNV